MMAHLGGGREGPSSHSRRDVPNVARDGWVNLLERPGPPAVDEATAAWTRELLTMYDATWG
jgi:hypothetical protein